MFYGKAFTVLSALQLPSYFPSGHFLGLIIPKKCMRMFFHTCMMQIDLYAPTSTKFLDALDALTPSAHGIMQPAR